MSSDRRQPNAATLARVCVLTLAVAARVHASAPTHAEVALDPTQTVVAFRVSGTLHDTHGTFRLTEGRLDVDQATGAAGGLVVVDTASGDTHNAARDARMKARVLDAGRYPEMQYRPRRVDGQLEADGSFRGTMHGVLTLHGADHELSVETEGRIVGDALTATCRFAVPYVAWGLPDPSVPLLAVAKTVDVEVKAVGRVSWTTDTREVPR